MEPSVEPVSVNGEGTAYAYVLDYNTDLGTPVLARLLQDGVTARVAKRPIVANGTTYPRGSVVITRRNNEALWDGGTVDRTGHRRAWAEGGTP